MSNAEATSSSGVGVVGLLTVAFVVLKLTGQISWSWWWVLSPVWISAGVTILLCVLAFIIAARFAR